MRWKELDRIGYTILFGVPHVASVVPVVMGRPFDIETMASVVVPATSFTSSVMDYDLTANWGHGSAIEIEFAMY